MCALDISKAFGRVNNYALLSLLIDRKVPKYFITIMLKWFQHSTASVRWGGALSATFDTLAGVRQGGLLSPLLFSVYMDVLILTDCSDLDLVAAWQIITLDALYMLTLFYCHTL